MYPLDIWVGNQVGLICTHEISFPTCFHREKCFRLSWAMSPPFSNQGNTGLQGWSKRNEKSRLGHLSKRPDATAIFNNSYHSIHSGLLKTVDIFKRGFSSNGVYFEWFKRITHHIRTSNNAIFFQSHVCALVSYTHALFGY